MAFVIEELTDPSRARPALDVLAKSNSEHIDLHAEARLTHARFWIAHTGDVSTPVAYALVWLLGDEAEIVDLATSVHWRRRGVARELLTELSRRYRASGVAAVYLEVRASNHAAIALYSQLGWQRTRVRRGYYDDGEDAWDMHKSLTT